MQKYVVGFMFDAAGQYVVLIRKEKPEWQSGYLNGVGGKVEPEEDFKTAMIREFEEETGVNHLDWELFAHSSSKHHEIQFYRAFSDNLYDVRTMTDEVVSFYNVSDIFRLHTIYNLKWLVPMALSDDLALPVYLNFISTESPQESNNE